MRAGRVPRLGGRPSRQPLRPPAGTLKAKSFKKRCLQATLTQDSTYGNEDCLYLNIWVPQGRKEGPSPPTTPSSSPSSQRPGSGPWVVSRGSRAELQHRSDGVGGWAGRGRGVGVSEGCIWHHAAYSPPPQSPTTCPS